MAMPTTQRGPWRILAPAGRLDAHTAPDLEAACAAALGAGDADLALDLAAVDYLSSAGLRVFLWTFRQLQGRNRRFALLHPAATVREVLEVSGFTALFPILDGPETLPAAP